MADLTTQLSQKPLDQWSAEDVATAAKAGLPATYDVARAMLEDHDYLQNGALWISQRAGGPLNTLQMDRIKDVFVPDPLLEEIRENRTNGLLQREPSVAFDAVDPKDGEQEADDQRVTDVVKAIARWWDKKKFWAKAREAFGRTSYSRRSALRVWIPDANKIDVVRKDGTPAKLNPTVATLEEALDRIEVEAPLPDTAGLFTLASQRQVAVVLMGDQENRRTELWSIENGQSVVRIPGKRAVFPSVGTAARESVAYDLGGRLPVVEMKTPELVTAPVIRQQSLLNTETTVLECVVEKAGFPERYIANAEPPGLWLPYPPENEPPLEAAKDANGSTIYKHRAPWVFGFVTVAEVVGIRQTETLPSGGTRESFATPSITRFEPVDPTYIKTSMELTRNRLYHLCRQGHLANDSTAEASGIAYQQARAGFEADLLTLKGGLEGMVRDAIEVVLAYAGLMHADTKQFLEDFRCVVTLHVTSGPVTPAEMQETRANRDAGLLSRETAMGRLGVEDIGAEMAAILADPAANAEQWVKIAAAINAILALGNMANDGAGALLNLSPDQIDILRTGVAPTPGSKPPPRLVAA